MSNAGFLSRLVIACCSSALAALLFQFFGGQVGAGVVGGTIAFFNTSCPQTWTEYTPLQGRYPVGLVAGGTLEASVGGSLSNTENRLAGTHSHSVGATHSHTVSENAHGHTMNDPQHDHTISETAHVHTMHYVNYSIGTEATTFRAIEPSGSNMDTDSTITGININDASTGISVNTNTTGLSVDSKSLNLTSGDAGAGSGTPAPYVQLRACRKD